MVLKRENNGGGGGGVMQYMTMEMTEVVEHGLEMV